MKKIVLAALIAAVTVTGLALSSTASAQSNAELRQDRRDIREERRDLDRAYRSGDPRRIHEERRDLHEARREYREDLRDRERHWRDDDWRSWRNQNRAVFAHGDWRAPFRYTRFQPGYRIAAPYYAPRYVIVDPWRYHLPAAGPARVWVRHYRDLVLVDTRRGVVVRVIPGFYW